MKLLNCLLILGTISSVPQRSWADISNEMAIVTVIGKAEIFISNLVKFRPPNNQTPTFEEGDAWAKLYLLKEIKMGISYAQLTVLLTESSQLGDKYVHLTKVCHARVEQVHKGHGVPSDHHESGDIAVNLQLPSVIAYCVGTKSKEFQQGWFCLEET